MRAYLSLIKPCCSVKRETEVMEPSEILSSPVLNDAYRPLSSLYLAFLLAWSVSALSWTFNTWNNRHWQMNNLQWMLTSVPLIKAVQLGLSFLFWYSCFNLQTCSLWISFGIYVTGILFQTACFLSFLLISHGYCIMSEHLSVLERRITAAIGSVLYLTLLGYKAAIPFFSVLMLLSYSISFYVILHLISQNLLVLRGQLDFIEDEEVHIMHDAIYTKYTMYKKFQGAIQIVAVAEILIYINMDGVADNYWLRLLVREWVQLCVFFYIGWTFRSQEVSAHFSVMPTLKSEVKRTIAPIYSLEISATDFSNFTSHDWQIGVPTSYAASRFKNSRSPLLIVVQQPC